MTDYEKLKNDIHEIVMEYVKQYMIGEHHANVAERLGVDLVAASVANKQNEDSETAVLLQDEDGSTAAVRAKEPGIPYLYQIYSVEECCLGSDCRQTKEMQEQLEDWADCLLAIAYDYVQKHGIHPEDEMLKVCFFNITEAIDYYLAQLENNQTEHELVVRIKELLRRLKEEF